MNVSGGTLSSLGVGITNNTYFTGVYVLTQTNINAGFVTGSICICGDNSVQYCVNGINTTLNLSNGIRLQAFIDNNGNGIQDTNELNYSDAVFNYSINSGAITNLNSSSGIAYLYETNSLNSYDFNLTTNNPNYTCSTLFSNITVPTGSGITTYKFPIIPNPITDVILYFSQSSVSPRPGFTYQNLILIRNSGNQTITSGTVTFNHSPVVSITNISVSGTTAITNGFTYNYINLLPLENRYIYVTMLVPTIPTVALGQQLINTVSITPIDTTPLNNTATITQTIVGSYDPNDKQENHGGKIVHSTFTANDYLTYTIQFENTGTANAINIKVDDVLNTKLDETSIRMIDASYPYILQRTGNNLSWKFNGVNLPPSNGSATVGHGAITFQIKPKSGYAIGDIIPNTANIYFDFNPAIVTNTCTTEFVATLSNNNFAFNNFTYYPNPVKNTLSITNSFSIDSVEISSLLGQKMMSKVVNSLQAEIDLSSLSTGVYFVKATSDGQEKTIKIVKE